MCQDRKQPPRLDALGRREDGLDCVTRSAIEGALEQHGVEGIESVAGELGLFVGNDRMNLETNPYLETNLFEELAKTRSVGPDKRLAIGTERKFLVHVRRDVHEGRASLRRFAA